jgi:hypothetical protein
MQIFQELIETARKQKRTGKIKVFLSCFAVIMSIWGTVTFSLFILEESFQCAMFGTWPAQDANRWDLVRTGTKTMQGTVNTLRTVNNIIGWIQPLAFLSYRDFGKSAQGYIDSLNAKALAHDPSMFLDEVVTIDFAPKDIKYLPDGSLLLSGGKLGVICHEDRRRKSYHITGLLVEHKDKFVIDLRDKD